MAVQFPEWWNAFQRTNLKYSIAPEKHGPLFQCFIDEEGLPLWMNEYFAKRAAGKGHEQAIREVEDRIDFLEGRVPQWGTQPGPVGPVTPGTVAPLESRGVNFYVAGSDEVRKLRGVTAFDAFKRWLNGEHEHLETYLSFTQSIGADTWAVFGCWETIQFRAQDYWDTYLTELEQFARWLFEHGTRLWWIPFTGQQEGVATRLDEDTQNRIILHSVEILKPVYGMLEPDNEDWQNGNISARFPAEWFSGILACRSAFQDGQSYLQTGSLLTHTNEHTPRDAEWMRKFKNGYETSVQGLGNIAPPSRRPSVLREPMGIASADEPGRRSSNSTAFLEYHGGAELLTAGSFLHGDLRDLQSTTPPVDTALLCAQSVGNAWRAWLSEARKANELGRYVRGSQPGFPMDDDGTRALRSYALIVGDVAYVTFVQLKPGYRPQAINGWQEEHSAFDRFFTLRR